MKRMKIAAAAVVLVMLASAMIIGVNATQYDAEGDENNTNTPSTAPVYKVDISGKKSVDVILNSNINYYYQLDPNATIEWRAGKETMKTPGKTYDQSGNESGNPDYEAALGIAGDENSLSVKTEVIGGTADDKKIKLTISRNNTSDTIDFFYVEVTVKITVNNVAVTMDSFTYKIDILGNTGSHEFSVTLVKNSNTTVDIQGDGVDMSKYIFYGAGTGGILGMSLTSDGKLSGIVSGEVGTYIFYILMEKKETGQISHATLYVEIVDFTYTVTSDNRPLPSNGSAYYIEQGKQFSVNIITEKSQANYISVAKLDINSNDHTVGYDLIKIENGVATINGHTNGTGAYRVYIGYAEGENPTNLSAAYTYFELHVIGKAVGVESEIIVGSR